LVECNWCGAETGADHASNLKVAVRRPGNFRVFDSRLPEGEPLVIGGELPDGVPLTCGALPFCPSCATKVEEEVQARLGEAKRKKPWWRFW